MSHPLEYAKSDGPPEARERGAVDLNVSARGAVERAFEGVRFVVEAKGVKHEHRWTKDVWNTTRVCADCGYGEALPGAEVIVGGKGVGQHSG